MQVGLLHCSQRPRLFPFPLLDAHSQQKAARPKLPLNFAATSYAKNQQTFRDFHWNRLFVSSIGVLTYDVTAGTLRWLFSTTVNPVLCICDYAFLSNNRAERTRSLAFTTYSKSRTNISYLEYVSKLQHFSRRDYETTWRILHIKAVGILLLDLWSIPFSSVRNWYSSVTYGFRNR